VGRPGGIVERHVRLVAGGLVLAGVLASVLVPTMKRLAATIGGGLAVVALTDSCVMGLLLSKLPYNRDANCDLQAVLAELTDTTRD
jgi:hypothetical protein